MRKRQMRNKSMLPYNVGRASLPRKVRLHGIIVDFKYYCFAVKPGKATKDSITYIYPMIDNGHGKEALEMWQYKGEYSVAELERLIRAQS